MAGYSIPQRITQAEFIAAQSCIYYSADRFADGRGNFTPEALISQMRGARFDSNGPLFKSDMMIIDKAMRDLADFLGFPDTTSYNNTMLVEGSKIFQRAKKIIPIPTDINGTSSYPFTLLTPNNL